MKRMDVCVRTFEELTREELYQLLRVRVAVFVVEQNCPYQELDNRDQAAVHVWLQDEDGIAARLRVMDRGVESEDVSIGRVISMRRGQGIGSRLMAEGIRAARAYFGAQRIYLEAQTYAVGFYERQGFRVVSEEFLEDGIPHVRMLREEPEGEQP